jgi:hypothetical protein
MGYGAASSAAPRRTTHRNSTPRSSGRPSARIAFSPELLLQPTAVCIRDGLCKLLDERLVFVWVALLLVRPPPSVVRLDRLGEREELLLEIKVRVIERAEVKRAMG